MAMATRNRSARMERAYDRLGAAYGGSVDVATYTAAGVYDKLGLLVLLALVTGAVGYATASTALLVVGLLGGLVLAMVGIFRPTAARFVAPLYALAEGLALGALTALYATGSKGVAPLAIVFTAAVFVGALVVFRSGFVKVTPRFVSMTIMAGFGFLAVLIAGLFGLFPGLSSQTGLLVIGVIGVVIGVMYLFIDFNAVQLGEQRRLPAEAEWYGALMLMMSLVFVYINVLRVVASRRR
jgi:uncharacterized YccA/Bax inhibitor family protein